MKYLKKLLSLKAIKIAWSIIKILFAFAFALISSALLILFVLAFFFGLSDLFSGVNPTIIAVIISSVLALLTFLLNKYYERKMQKLKDDRTLNIEKFQNYIDYLLEYEDKQDIDLHKLLNLHSQLIFYVDDNALNSMNFLVIAVSQKDKDKIETAIINIIHALRKQFGYTGLFLKFKAIRKYVFPITTKSNKDIK